MVPATASEFLDLGIAVRGVLDRHWPHEQRISRDESVLEELWREAVAHGWTELHGAEDHGPLLCILEELGRANAGIPVLDAFVAASVLPDDLAAAVATGELTVVVGRDDGGVTGFLESAALATHVLTLPAGVGPARLDAIPEQSPLETPGIAPEPWTSVALPAVPEQWIELGGEALEAALRAGRVGLAARALGAARRAHELAIEHAKTREQFGSPIGRFQAVSHRIATCAIDLESAAALLADAVESEDVLVASLAVAHAQAALPRVALGALHTLGGMGFHEEHEGAWLFRRVYGDVTRAMRFASAREDPGTLLVEGGAPLPSVDLGRDANAFRDEIGAFFDEHWDPARNLDEDAQFDPELRSLLVERGWLGAGWPREWGGQERTPEELLVLNEEVRYRGVPIRRLLTTVNIVGEAIMRHGTSEQKQRYLPGIREGRTLFCLGYSEPGAGSDLASLRTAAVKRDDGWVVNGQKIFTTFGHRSDYHWLAVRTDPDASPPHAGISVFIVPLDSPGLTIQQNRALNGEITTTIFYDDVFVPDDAVVGTVNGGWPVIGTALSVERVQMGGNVAELRGILDGLLTLMREDPTRYAGGPSSWQRQAVVELTAWLHAVRLFVVTGVRALAADRPARLPAAMAKVAGGEAAERLADVALRIVGPTAALEAGSPGTALEGAVERMLRLAPMYVIGGGTNDIQRNLIARELGLPR